MHNDVSKSNIDRHLQRIEWSPAPSRQPDLKVWPYNIPAVAQGSQIIVATHSPLLASLPGATLLELGEHGIRRVDSFDDLSLVKNWRLFLNDPHRFLRHLIGN